MRRFAIFMLLMLALAACSGGDTSAAEDSLPSGDAARGAALFTQAINGAPTCASCHTVDDSTLTAPSLKGFAAVAGTRVDGESAEEYAYTSITQPAAFVVSGFGNLMYNQYAQRLDPQQIADLIVYLLSL